MTLAHREAIKAIKLRLQRQGLKLSRFSHRDIVIEAEQYLAEHQAELFPVAKAMVDRWYAEGVFGPRGGIRIRS